MIFKNLRLISMLVVFLALLFLTGSLDASGDTSFSRADAVKMVSKEMDAFLKSRYGSNWLAMIPDKEFLGFSINYWYVGNSRKMGGYISIDTRPCCLSRPWDVVVSISNWPIEGRRRDITIFRMSSRFFEDRLKFSEALNRSLQILKEHLDPILLKK